MLLKVLIRQLEVQTAHEDLRVRVLENNFFWFVFVILILCLYNHVGVGLLDRKVGLSEEVSSALFKGPVLVY